MPLQVACCGPYAADQSDVCRRESAISYCKHRGCGHSTVICYFDVSGDLFRMRVEAAWCGRVPKVCCNAGPAVLCVAAGLKNGEEVLGLLDVVNPPARGEIASPIVSFRKPRGLGSMAAAQLMLPALTACAALQASGLKAAHKQPPHVLVAGSSGRLPQILVPLLREAGCEVSVAGRDQDRAAMLALGAETAFDHNAVSFAEARGSFGPWFAVLDTLGNDDSPELFEEMLGARYLSLASPPLLELVGDGAVSVLRRLWQQRRDEGAAPAWMPAAGTLELVDALLAAWDDGRAAPPQQEAGGLAQVHPPPPSLALRTDLHLPAPPLHHPPPTHPHPPSSLSTGAGDAVRGVCRLDVRYG